MGGDYWSGGDYQTGEDYQKMQDITNEKMVKMKTHYSFDRDNLGQCFSQCSLCMRDLYNICEDKAFQIE